VVMVVVGRDEGVEIFSTFDGVTLDDARFFE
jgi:hypothetical protein